MTRPDEHNLEGLGRLLEDRREAERLRETWDALGAIDEEAPRSSLAAVLEELLPARETAESAPASPRSRVAAGLAGIVIGAVLGIGLSSVLPSGEEATVRALRREITALRESVEQSLSHPQTAGRRLRALEHLDDAALPADAIVSTLIGLVLDDPSLNLRLAALERLEDLPLSRSDALRLAEAIEREPAWVQLGIIDLFLVQAFSDARPTLERVAQDDGQESLVRDHAAWALTVL